MPEPDLALFLVVNDAYAPGAAATLASAAAGSSRPLRAYVVDIDLRDASRRRLEAAGTPVTWLRLDAAQRELLGSFHRHDRYTHWEVYTRVLLPLLLPPGVDRVVSLDADTVVLGDLAELAGHDLGGGILGAVDDRWIAGMYVRRLLGADPRRPLRIPRYFNAGVMVVDVAAWRRHEVSERTVALLGEHRPFAYYEQDPLNLLLAGQWHELPEPWNRLAPAPQVTPAPSSAVTRQGGVDRGRLLDGARIVHFIGTRKPWLPDTGYEPELLAVFERFADRTAPAPGTGS
ncbi:glycosyltransferase family 8 protein [Catellatospora methionotrophica]|uniref:glycosyltransferase family 8 protein n=1 Tax=Catellatospora methionotrophica TaxID=121620 RepID=UPI0033DB999F